MSWPDRRSRRAGRWSGRALLSDASTLDVGDLACRQKGNVQARQGENEELNEINVKDLPD